MSDPLVEQLSRAFDTLSEQVRAAIAEHAAVKLEQLSAAVNAERQAVAEKARLDATAATRQAVTDRLTEDFGRREAQIRDQARTEGFETGLEQGRAEAASALEAQTAEAAAALAATVARMNAEQGTARESDQQAHASALAAQAAAQRAAIARLSIAMRQLDAATSLSQTLNTLVEAAGAEAERTALFLVRGDILRLWSQSGFDLLAAQPAFELPLADADIVAEAVRASEPRITNGTRPAFSSGVPASFVVVPLALNGQVTAVLCAEGTTVDDEGGRLASTVDILARHAARVLECLTALRLAHAGGRPAASLATGM